MKQKLSTIFNDFGKKRMGRYYFTKKTEADSLKKITVFTLKKEGFLNGGFVFGVATWKNGLLGNETSVHLTVFTGGEENYLRLYYNQIDETGNTQNFDYKLALVTTPCYFGGRRYWIKCLFCGRRVGVIYKGGDYFACRHCYNLSYSSKNKNRNSTFYSLFRALDYLEKAGELKSQIKRKRYRRKLTKKQLKLQSIRLKAAYYYFLTNRSNKDR